LSSDEIKYECVFRSYDRVNIALAKSILSDNKIEYIVQNEDLNFLFGSGGLLKNANPGISPVELYVPIKFAEKAKGILKDLS